MEYSSSQDIGAHESRLKAGSIPVGTISGRISMGTIATIQARAGERNGCIKVRFLGRSYYPILNKIVQAKKFTRKNFGFSDYYI